MYECTCHLQKIIAKVLLNQLPTMVEGLHTELQHGFCPFRSTVLGLYDLRQAFDSIYRKELWHTLFKFSVPHNGIQTLILIMVMADTTREEPFLSRLYHCPNTSPILHSTVLHLTLTASTEE